jgi:hypothetical protein
VRLKSMEAWEEKREEKRRGKKKEGKSTHTPSWTGHASPPSGPITRCARLKEKKRKGQTHPQSSDASDSARLPPACLSCPACRPRSREPPGHRAQSSLSTALLLDVCNSFRCPRPLAPAHPPARPPSRFPPARPPTQPRAAWPSSTAFLEPGQVLSLLTPSSSRSSALRFPPARPLAHAAESSAASAFHTPSSGRCSPHTFLPPGI